MQAGKLILLPNFLGPTTKEQQFPLFNEEWIKQLKYFFVENPKPARALIKALNPNVNFNEAELFQFDKHAKDNSGTYREILTCLKAGNNVGVLSDAGCPGIADPGAELISWAHKNNIEVLPLVGPSSILLTLMASGLNGQNFQFIGYLPKESKDKINQVKNIANQTKNGSCTVMFIETPYKNEQTFRDLLENLPGSNRICLGINLFFQDQKILTKTVADWKSLPNKPQLKDQQVLFAVG